MKFKKVFLVVLLDLMILSLISCTQKAYDADTTNHDENALNYKIERQENWISVNDEIFISMGSNKENVILIKSGDEAVVIDTGYDESVALRVKEFIDENNLKLKNLILTHRKDDQTGNISMFKGEGVITINPVTAKNNQIITLGDKTLKLLSTPGLYNDQHFSVEIDDEILIAGDILTTGEINQTCVTYDNFNSLIQTLEKLNTKEYSLIIPGHGDIFLDNSIISKNLEERKKMFSNHKVNEETDSWQVIDDDIFVSISNHHHVNMVLVTSGSEATIIDTGNDPPEAEAVKKYIEDNNLTLKNLIITHGHEDHVANIDMFLNDDVKFYNFANSNDNQIIEMGDKKFKIIFTPGHANNEHISVEINNKVLVSGDVILIPESYILGALNDSGDYDALVKTLEDLSEKHYDLIIPGHGHICIGDSIIDMHLEVLEKNKEK